MIEIKKCYFKPEVIPIRKCYFKKEIIHIKKIYFKPEETTERLCSYNFIKGRRAGTICDCKALTDSDFCKKHQKESNKVDNILKLKRHPKLNVLFDPKSKLVFESDTNKVVIGIIKDNAISDDYDTEFCKKNGFRFKKKINNEFFLQDLMLNGIKYIERISEKDLFQIMVSNL